MLPHVRRRGDAPPPRRCVRICGFGRCSRSQAPTDREPCRRSPEMPSPPPVLAIRRIGGGVTGFSQVGIWGTQYSTAGPRHYCERVRSALFRSCNHPKRWRNCQRPLRLLSPAEVPVARGAALRPGGRGRSTIVWARERVGDDPLLRGTRGGVVRGYHVARDRTADGPQAPVPGRAAVAARTDVVDGQPGGCAPAGRPRR